MSDHDTLIDHTLLAEHWERLTAERDALRAKVARLTAEIALLKANWPRREKAERVMQDAAESAEDAAIDMPALTDEACEQLSHAHIQCAIDRCVWCRALARIAQDRAALARLTARIEELESALRLNLAVAPDDPLLLTPVERQLYACREENERLKQDSQWAHGRVDELAAEVGRLRADLATCRVALAEIATDPRDPDYHRRFHPTTICDTCIARAALAQLTAEQ